MYEHSKIAKSRWQTGKQNLFVLYNQGQHLQHLLILIKAFGAFDVPYECILTLSYYTMSDPTEDFQVNTTFGVELFAVQNLFNPSVVSLYYLNASK